jgi:hypothetical protein
MAITSGCCGNWISAESKVLDLELMPTGMGGEKRPAGLSFDVSKGVEGMIIGVAVVVAVVVGVDVVVVAVEAMGKEEEMKEKFWGALLVSLGCVRSRSFSVRRRWSCCCRSLFCVMSCSICASMVLWCFFFFSLDVAAAARFCARLRSFFSVSLRGRFSLRSVVHLVDLRFLTVVSLSLSE